MRNRSKRYEKAKALVDSNKRYELDEAVGLLKKCGGTKFDQTVELAMRLGIDVKKSDQAVRGSITLPHGIGKSRKVVVFAEGEDAKTATAAGADEVGGDTLIAKVQGGWMDFDVAIAVPYMMVKVGKLGKTLGPQGKMPSPKAGTVVTNIALAVKEFKAGKIEYRADANGNVHVPVGKLSFTEAQIKENVEMFIEHIRATKPSSAKGTFVMNIGLSCTMGPGIALVMAQ
jgi:large subunit ribosomal protein L1